MKTEDWLMDFDGDLLIPFLSHPVSEVSLDYMNFDLSFCLDLPLFKDSMEKLTMPLT